MYIVFQVTEILPPIVFWDIDILLLSEIKEYKQLRNKAMKDFKKKYHFMTMTGRKTAL